MFCSIIKGVLLNCIPVLFPKYLTLVKKAPCDALSLELYTPFDLQPVIYSVPFSTLDALSLELYTPFGLQPVIYSVPFSFF